MGLASTSVFTLAASNAEQADREAATRMVAATEHRVILLSMIVASRVDKPGEIEMPQIVGPVRMSSETTRR